MYLDDVQRLNNHWRRHPPLRSLVAACAGALGVKMPEPADPSSPPKYLNADEAMRMMAATGGRIPGVGGA